MSIKSKNIWNADYHKQSNFQFNVGKQALKYLNLKGTERILDIGCGTGKTTNYCANLIPEGSIVGLDLSSDMINFAKEEYKATSNLKFIEGSATNIPFENEFDVVFSMYCLHWIEDQQKVIDQIAKSLKSGGQALLYIPCRGALLDNFEKCTASIVEKKPNWKKHTSYYYFIQPSSVWLRWIKDQGFQVKKHQVIEQKKIFDTLQDCKKYMQALSVAPNLPKKERLHFLEMLLSELYKIYNKGENDQFEYITSTLVLHIIKK